MQEHLDKVFWRAQQLWTGENAAESAHKIDPEKVARMQKRLARSKPFGVFRGTLKRARKQLNNKRQAILNR